MKTIIATITCGLAVLAAYSSRGQSTVSVDFNSPGELTSQFNDGYSTPTWTQNSSGGIAGSGGITIPTGTSDLYISKQGFAVQAGATYTVGAYYFDQDNGGYGGLGFTALTTGTINGGEATPLSAIGVSFHGGGGFMDNNSAATKSYTSVNWTTPINPIPADQTWFYFQDTITFSGANTFSQNFEIWQSDANGDLGTQFTDTTVTGQINATLGGATTIYPFMSASYDRFTAADNFSASEIVPTPEPATWAMGLVGGLLFLVAARNKRPKSSAA